MDRLGVFLIYIVLKTESENIIKKVVCTNGHKGRLHFAQQNRNVSVTEYNEIFLTNFSYICVVICDPYMLCLQKIIKELFRIPNELLKN